MPIGFRVLKRKRAVSPDIVEKFRGLPVANISDVMLRVTAGGPRLRPMHAGGVMCGPALTARSRPGDNLMAHKALIMAQPGDVIVVDAGGDLTNAIIGELMLAFAVKQQVGGIVINGSVRDIAAIRACSLPVYAAGVTHRGPYKDGPGEINVPVSLDGMTIEPGDLVIGDDDGLLCVPYDDVEAIYQLAFAKHASETKSFAAIEAGTRDRSWIDKELLARGCTIEE